MNKIKLGVSAGLTGAILYFLGAISIIPAVILAGYILLKEENDWLKYQAVKMVMIVVIFGAINIGLNCIDDIFAIFNQVIGIFAKNVHIAVPLGLIYSISSVMVLWLMKGGVDMRCAIDEIYEDGIAEGEKRGLEIGEARGEARGTEWGIRHMLKLLKSLGYSGENAATQLAIQCNLPDEQAREYLKKYWNAANKS